MSLVLGLRSWYSFNKGFLSPADAVAAAKVAIDRENAVTGATGGCIAYADHGEIAGHFEFADACREHGLTYIPGIEANLKYQNEIRPIIVFGIRSEGQEALMNLLANSSTTNEPTPAGVDPSLPLLSMEHLNSPALLLLSGQESSHLLAFRRRRELLSAQEFIRDVRQQGARIAMAVDPTSIDLVDERFLTEISNLRVGSVPFRPGIIANFNQLFDYNKSCDIAFPPDQAAPVPYSFDIPEIATTSQIAALGNRPIPGYNPDTLEKLSQNAGIVPVPITKSHSDISYDGLSPDDALALLKMRCFEGLSKKIGIDPQDLPVYHDRLEMELGLISSVALQSQILYTASNIGFCTDNQQQAFARGSAANSLACWTLGISIADPIVHNLPVERFLNPERPTMPDIDVDIPSSFSPSVVRHMIENVPNSIRIRQSQNATLGRLMDKSAKLFGIRYPERISTALRAELGISAFPKGDAMAILQKQFPDFKKRFLSLREDQSAEMGDLFRTLCALGARPTGFEAHVGIAASGKPIQQTIPVIPVNFDGTTQMAAGIPHNAIEKHGIIKFDFPPSKNLDRVRCIINRSSKEMPSLEDAARHQSPEMYSVILKNGLVAGIPQIHKYREVLKIIKPSKFSDLSAFTSLIRPGAAKRTEDNRKTILPPGVDLFFHGKSPFGALVSKLGPKAVEVFKKHTDETRGFVIYDEQFSMLLHDLSLVSVGKCEELRGAKKKGTPPNPSIVSEVVNGIEKQFGSTPALANDLFSALSNEGGYLFPKGHSVTYSAVGCQLMEMKLRDPAAFVAGHIDHFWEEAIAKKSPSRTEFKEEMSSLFYDTQKLGCHIHRMDFSKSLLTDVTPDGNLRLGLDAISSIDTEEIKRIKANAPLYEQQIKNGVAMTPDVLSQAPYFLSPETIAKGALLGGWIGITTETPGQIAAAYAGSAYSNKSHAVLDTLGFLPNFALPAIGCPKGTPKRGKDWDAPVSINDVALGSPMKDSFFVSGLVTSVRKQNNKNGHSVDFQIWGGCGARVPVKMWFSVPRNERTNPSADTLARIKREAESTAAMLDEHLRKTPYLPVTLNVKLTPFDGSPQLTCESQRIHFPPAEIPPTPKKPPQDKPPGGDGGVPQSPPNDPRPLTERERGGRT